MSKKPAQCLRQLAGDAGLLRVEVNGLMAMRQQIRDLHVPMNVNGKAVCTGCSVEGGQVPWPCAT